MPTPVFDDLEYVRCGVSYKVNERQLWITSPESKMFFHTSVLVNSWPIYIFLDTAIGPRAIRPLLTLFDKLSPGLQKPSRGNTSCKNNSRRLGLYKEYTTLAFIRNHFFANRSSFFPFKKVPSTSFLGNSVPKERFSERLVD